VARTKSLLPNLKIDLVKRAHDCQHNNRHRLRMGDKRLKVRVNRSDEHFCAPCALIIIGLDITKLQALANELTHATSS